MKILVVASEAVPFVKTGGLGDVIGALPKALARLGHDVKVFIPRYDNLNVGYHQPRTLSWTSNIVISGIKHSLAVEVIREKKLSLEHYFIKNDHYFRRKGLYRDESNGGDFTDNDERFIFFSQSVLKTVRELDWKPDVIHAHDWQAALLPSYLAAELKEDPFFGGTKSVLTIHNLAFQGTFPAERFDLLGLPDGLFAPTAPFEFYGQVNFLKAAIVFADKITTVSERYAQEIQAEEHGCGLDGVLRNRRNDLVGILNGVDYTVWSPSRDKKIPYAYHPANLSGKKMNKVELLNESGLPVRERTPLIGVISRLSDQKGFDLIAEVAEKIFALDLQMIVLGTGDEKYHQLFTDLQQKYPDKMKVHLGFDDTLAHRIEAASDIFLMPSRFEPCGLNQMYSLKYGTIPIVREVGGLADTVTDFNPATGEGTGFVFKEYTSDAMLTAIERAVEVYQKKRVWTKLMKAGMARDNSWDRAARKYIDLFKQLVG